MKVMDGVMESIFGVIGLIIFFGVYSSANTTTWDATTVIIAGMIGTFLGLILLIGLYRLARGGMNKG
jgi:hypothetical protein